MSKPVAILPIKSFDQAKQRLRDALGPAPRAALVQAMFSDVLIALGRTTQIERVLVVSSDHGAQRIAEGYGAIVVDDDQRGHNQAASRGIAHALKLGATRALLVPGDCPLLDPGELDALITRHTEPRSVVIVPDRHGTGTNALLLSPPNALGPAFGPLSRTRHEQKARAAGLTPATVTVSTLALDLDTPEDLVAIEAALRSGHGGAAHTRGMLAQLARIRERL
ncbi:MAG: 2-phospho-L-lactate guanylyltransferase [Solirubrobacteraceae bacterium]